MPSVSAIRFGASIWASVVVLLSLPPIEAEAIPIGARPAGGSQLAGLEPVFRSAERHDTSVPLRRIDPIRPQDEAAVRVLPTRALVKGADVARPGEPDGALDRGVAVSDMPSPIQNFEGVGNVNGVLPPDTDGDVGPNHYVQMVNISFAIYDKAGALLYGPASNNTLWTGFGGLCETTNRGDPVVLYDPLADRWVLSQFAFERSGGNPIGPFYECIAISQTPNPTGAWHRYAFLISATKMNDYPKFGVWPDAYYMSVNQFESGSWAGAGAAAFERDQMLLGLPADMVYFDIGASTTAFGGMLPADLDGTRVPPADAPNPFVEFDDNAWGWSTDRLHLFEFHVDWVTPAFSTFTGPGVINTAAFDSNLCNYSRDCIPQPGVAANAHLDAISDRLMFRLQYRNVGTHQAMVANHTVDTGGDVAAIRWYELRNASSGWSILQQGTYAPGDGLHRWVGSIAMDGQGNIALGYSTANGTAPGGYPSIRYVGRLAADPAGTMPQGETTLIAGGGSQTNTLSRWGDYSAMTVDPDDGCTFWYTSEYYASTSSSSWKTRIGSFRFPACTDAEPPLNPTLSSPTHAPSTWSSDPTIEIGFGGPLSADTDGFSYLFDTDPATAPDTTKDDEDTATGTTSPSFPDGDSYWFHIRTLDVSNNWSAPRHFGPFFIDTVPPTDPGVSSPSHQVNVPSNATTIDISLTGAADATSGVDGYSFLFDTSPATVPDTTKDIDETTTVVTSPPLAGGAAYWFHLRTTDHAGNWTSTVHLGPFPINKGATTTTVKAKATKQRRIKVSGSLSPAHGGSVMEVTLFKRRDGFKRVKRIGAPIGAGGSFAATFKAPKAKRCRVTGTWAGDADHLGSSTSKTFRC